MDINGLSSSIVAMNTNQKTGDTIGTTVARKALDIQSSSAAQLISSVEQPAASNESHLGNNFDKRA